MILSKFFKNYLTIPQATELFEEVKSQTYPDINGLKRLVNFHKAPVGTKKEMQALDLKYRAMTHIPTTIEKTMAPYQLFEIHNPLWTLHYTAIAVFNITNAYDQLEPEYKQMDNCVKLMFEIKDQLINAFAPNLRATLRRRLGERN